LYKLTSTFDSCPKTGLGVSGHLGKILTLFLIVNWLYGSYAKQTVKPFIVSVIAEHFQSGIDVFIFVAHQQMHPKYWHLKVHVGDRE